MRNLQNLAIKQKLLKLIYWLEPGASHTSAYRQSGLMSLDHRRLLSSGKDDIAKTTPDRVRSHRRVLTLFSE